MNLTPNTWYLITYAGTDFIGMYRAFKPLHNNTFNDYLDGSRFLLPNMKTVRRVNEAQATFVELQGTLSDIMSQHPEHFT